MSAIPEATNENASAAESAFGDLEKYIALPRLTGLTLAPDGSRLVTSVAAKSADGKKYVNALWELDPTGVGAAHRLTRSAPGEAGAAFLPDGSLLFTSKRADPAVAEPDGDHPALWLLPASGGEARQVSSRPYGIGPLAVAAETGRIAFAAPSVPGSADSDEDAAKQQARKDAGVTAILHESYPVRYWDHDLGPTRSRIFVTEASDGERLPDARDLTPEPDGRIDGDLMIDRRGALIAYTRNRAAGPAVERLEIAVLDAGSGEHRLVIRADDAEFSNPRFSADGSRLVCTRHDIATVDKAPNVDLWLVDLASGEGRNPAPDLSLWPGEPLFDPSGEAIYFIADEQGHAPVFRLDLSSGAITRLTGFGSHSNLVVSPDGRALFALRSSYAAPSTPVRLDPTAVDQDGQILPSPADVGALPGRLVEVRTETSDGIPLRAWLALPTDASEASPAPLVLWIHGGPLSSWNTWSWRWNPWLLVARGYAVLLPDPALSTGYGQDFIQRGWAKWGGPPFTDLMAATDAACARPDIDDTRTAAMGGSFGGYMANWVATHTDRFAAIVTHASLWHLEGFSGTTDTSWYWQEEFGDPLDDMSLYSANSPHLYVRDIRTPMLVIHGDKDYRVPIGEGLRLWYDLLRHSVDAKFLYFSDENHWVLTPGHARVWYETVFAFLDHHVLGKPWQRPALL
jgi:dipeptidyl aminopeptidase/acylaminoacyl peptidase